MSLKDGVVLLLGQGSVSSVQVSESSMYLKVQMELQCHQYTYTPTSDP